MTKLSHYSNLDWKHNRQHLSKSLGIRSDKIIVPEREVLEPPIPGAIPSRRAEGGE